MNLRVLGCSGSDLPGHHLTSFCINQTILLDAGTITAALALEEQAAITDIFVSHPHLDHIKDILFLADNLIEFFANGSRPPVNICGLPMVIEAIAEHLLNDTIWPDFTVIPKHSPVLTYQSLTPGDPYRTGGLTVAPFPVNHACCASGFVLWGEKPGENLAYTGDTGPQEEFWKSLAALDFPVKNLITEASFPNSMEELALASKHLTPKLLRRELEKLPYRPKIFIYHMKSPFSTQIQEELQQELAGFVYHLMREEETFQF
jgi:cAMP phosphodiesterase